MQEKVLRVGLVGFGTVGCGVAKIILEQGDAIARRTGYRLELACVVDVDTTRERPVTLPDGVLTDDLNQLLNDETISVGIELIGGTTIAKDVQIKMLEAGKNVVTANKALLAEHGSELFSLAAEKGLSIAFEASCAGGIPIICSMTGGLVANNIMAMYGILNGTCNYILSNMTVKGEDFDVALKAAQELGFAEADPTLDINGMDSAHKLAILASLAFGHQVNLGDVYVEGIEQISKEDILFGQELDYVVKLLAIAHRGENGKISLRVQPCFIPRKDALAKVSGSFNAISLFGDAVGHIMLYGRGAGMMPTASAVVADILDVTFGNCEKLYRLRHLEKNEETQKLLVSNEESISRFYIRVMVADEKGVFAKVSSLLAEHEISISGVVQHELRGPENTVPVVITTHKIQQAELNAALKSLCEFEQVRSEPVCIRIVDIPEDKD